MCSVRRACPPPRRLSPFLLLFISTSKRRKNRIAEGRSGGVLQNRCAKTVVHPGGKARKGGKEAGEAGEEARERGFNEAGAHPMALMTLINCTKDGDQPLCTSHGNKRNLEEVLLTCLSPALSSARYANLKRSACSTRLLRVSSYFLFIRSPVTASLTTVKANERPKEKFLPKFANHRKIFRNSSSSTYTSTLKNDKERWNYEMCEKKVEALSTSLPHTIRNDTLFDEFSTLDEPRLRNLRFTGQIIA